MPTMFTAQNGAVIHQSTPMTVTGCPKTAPKKVAKHTKANVGKAGNAHSGRRKG
jgi:hypothetical protein